MRRHVNVLASIALVVGLAGMAAPLAGAAGSDTSARFVAGGGHLDATALQGSTPPVDAEAAAAVATCGISGVGPSPVPPQPPEPLPSPFTIVESVGGGCLAVPDGATERFRVHVDRFVPNVYTPVGVAVGYDVDGDSCIGCTAADELWRGRGSVTVPVLEDHRWAMAFVYAADVDAGGEPLAVAAIAGELNAHAADEASPCGDGPSIPSGGCEHVPEAALELHLCVPTCVPVIDTPQAAEPS